MYEKIMRGPGLTRHRNAPFFCERERFLKYLDGIGTATLTLSNVSRALYKIVSTLDIKHTTVSNNDILKAANRWRTKNKIRSSNNYYFFIHIATDWCRFLKIYCEPSDYKTSVARLFPVVKDYEKYLSQEAEFADVTRQNYRKMAYQFLFWFSKQNKKFSAVTIQDVDKFLGLKCRSANRRSYAYYAQTLRAFFRYAEGRRFCMVGISCAIKSPTIYTHENLPKGPSWQKVAAVIASANRENLIDVRDRAVLLLLSVYALRSSEIVRLQLDDINWKEETINVFRSKNMRRQIFPLTREVGNAIIRYLKIRPKTKHREIFLTTKAPIGPNLAKNLGNITLRHFNRAGLLDEHRGPHSLRHACATHLMGQGLSLKEIGQEFKRKELGPILGS